MLLDSQTKEILKYQSFVQENKKIVKAIHLNEEHMAFTKSYKGPGEI